LYIDTGTMMVIIAQEETSFAALFTRSLDKPVHKFSTICVVLYTVTL
jgi:hypothetical protein